MISKDSKCIFVHIPKTAGTSIEKMIQGERYIKGWSSHQKIYEYQNDNKFNQYFKFSFVRNPYERILSVFNYYKHKGNNKELIYQPKKILNYFYKKMTTNKIFDIDISKRMPHAFDKFCELHIKEKLDFYGRNALDTQISFLKINNNIEVDFIGRFEQLEKDIAYIKNYLGIKASLGHQRKTKSRLHYSSFYNEFSKKIIKEAYGEEIELFKYRFENTKK